MYCKHDGESERIRKRLSCPTNPTKHNLHERTFTHVAQVHEETHSTKY